MCKQLHHENNLTRRPKCDNSAQEGAPASSRDLQKGSPDVWSLTNTHACQSAEGWKRASAGRRLHSPKFRFNFISEEKSKKQKGGHNKAVVLPECDFAPSAQRHLTMSAVDTFGCHMEEMHLAGMLLSILLCTKQSLQQRIIWPKAPVARRLGISRLRGHGSNMLLMLTETRREPTQQVSKLCPCPCRTNEGWSGRVR